MGPHRARSPFSARGNDETAAERRGNIWRLNYNLGIISQYQCVCAPSCLDSSHDCFKLTGPEDLEDFYATDRGQISLSQNALLCDFSVSIPRDQRPSHFHSSSNGSFDSHLCETLKLHPASFNVAICNTKWSVAGIGSSVVLLHLPSTAKSMVLLALPLSFAPSTNSTVKRLFSK